MMLADVRRHDRVPLELKGAIDVELRQVARITGLELNIRELSEP